MIFDGVVSASRKGLCDIFPSISKCGMQSKEHCLFLKRPWSAGDVWRKLIVPSESGLFLPLSNLL